MIQKINVRDKDIAMQIVNIQKPAYEMEAELIGYWGIPQLKDTVDTISRSSEEFYGFLINGKIAGVVSLNEYKDEIDICRLIVSPEQQRKGIGRKLIEYIQKTIGKEKRIIVCTGAKNIPAVALYHKLGFTKTNELEVAPGIMICQFEKE